MAAHYLCLEDLAHQIDSQWFPTQNDVPFARKVGRFWGKLYPEMKKQPTNTTPKGRLDYIDSLTSIEFLPSPQVVLLI